MTIPSTTYVIGSGVSSLSAAIYLSGSNCNISMHESSKSAGGRCRSFNDSVLNTTIDNGNHLILGANNNALEFIKIIKSEHFFNKITDSAFNFIDFSNENTWSISNIYKLYKELPGNNLDNISSLLRILKSPKGKTVSEHYNNSLYKHFWEPLAVSIMNTPCNIASAEMFTRVIKTIFKEGNNGLTAYLPKNNWDEALISPALNALENSEDNFEINYNSMITKLDIEDNKVIKIHTNKKEILLNKNDNIILGTPSYITSKLVPNISTPKEYHTIVNAHFRLPNNYNNSILGIIGGNADWLFFRKNNNEHMVSSTTSAADELAKLSDHEIAKLIWKDISLCLDIDMSHMPLYRIIKEKRATFSCTNSNEKLRPDTTTNISNLFLAGDYTNTHLPATIDGAILSGKKAAEAILNRK